MRRETSRLDLDSLLIRGPISCVTASRSSIARASDMISAYTPSNKSIRAQYDQSVFMVVERAALAVWRCTPPPHTRCPHRPSASSSGSTRRTSRTTPRSRTPSSSRRASRARARACSASSAGRARASSRARRSRARPARSSSTSRGGRARTSPAGCSSS
jgi:hypothetical protein